MALAAADPSCDVRRLPLEDPAQFGQCQLRASSTLSAQLPVSAAVHPRSLAGVDAGWRSNNYQGQWQGGQWLEVWLEAEYELHRLEVGAASSVTHMELRHTTDPRLGALDSAHSRQARSLAHQAKRGREGPDRGFWHDKHPTKCPSVSQQPETQPWVLRSPTTPPESPSTRLSLGQLAPLEALSDYLLDRRASIAVQLSSIRDTGRLNETNFQ